jgi:hypothetical protein
MKFGIYIYIYIPVLEVTATTYVINSSINNTNIEVSEIAVNNLNTS